MSEDINARPDYGGSLVTIQDYFSQREPMETPACWLKRSPSEGRSSRGGEWGGGVTSASSMSLSSSSSSAPEDSGSEGVSSPRSLAAARVALQARLLCLCAHNHSLWTLLASHLTVSSGKVTLHGATCVPKIKGKEKHACSEKQKLAQVDEDEIEWTYPRAFNPFPLMDWARAKV
jgi:hypothetical protein